MSRETVAAMALGAARLLGAQAGVGISGVAGPTGGSPDKPVGTVWIAWALDGVVRAERCRFPGDRDEVRRQTVTQALAGLEALLS